MFVYYFLNCFAVIYVGFDKNVISIFQETFEILEIARVSEFVEVDDWLVTSTEPVENEITANKPGAAGHEDGHFLRPCNIKTALIIAMPPPLPGAEILK